MSQNSMANAGSNSDWSNDSGANDHVQSIRCPIGCKWCEPMGHDVVRVQAQKHVRENAGVDHLVQRLAAQCAERNRLGRPVERHRRHPLANLHPSADPRSAVGDVVRAAFRRADFAELRVDRRAVVTLLVVLGEDLPVCSGVVGVTSSDLQSVRFVRGDERLQGCQAIVQRLAGHRRVDEDETGPLPSRKFDETVRRGVESIGVLKAARGFQVAAEVVAPRVVRTGDPRAVRRLSTGEEFVSSVPTRVREAVDLAVVVSGEEHAGRSDRFGALITRIGDVLTEADAHPTPAEEVLLFPREHRRVDVRRGGGASGSRQTDAASLRDRRGRSVLPREFD